ncbi:MAG TPA: ATP-binding protein [Phenylobacterium sp.]|nr:ATP-binding protein [Phenylobacterium sp.]
MIRDTAAMGQSTTAALREAFADRRRQLRLRVGLAVLMAATFGYMVGWVVVAVWAGAYLALQALETRLLAREGLPDWAGLSLLSANSVVFGLLAATGPVIDGVWGLASGVCLLCGAMLNAALTSQRSGAAFVASAAPFALYLLASPLAAVALGAQPHQAVSLAAAGVLIIVCSGMIWRAAANALNAERAARARAEAADAAKSAFVAMVGHELRTPISAILAGAAEAARHGSGGERDANLALIASSGRMMRTLLDDLLDLSKIEAGKMGVEAIAFDMRQLMLETVRFWAPEARRRRLRFRLNGARRLPGWAAGDPTRIRQILNNLLSNALKFTEAGAITLQVTADGEGRFSLSVSDTGQGMTEDQQAQLFQVYGQASGSVARTHGGTGLGLNISRELARLMGGDLTVTSRPGEGSTFTLDLPLPPAQRPQAASPAPTPEALRVLIVDDHEVNRRAFSMILKSAGAEIAVAVDGEDALAMLAVQPFDLVLMDLNMPRLGGLAAARRLRAEPGPNRQVPVIALTASVSPAEQASCLDAGMNAFVMKPVEAAELFAAIEAVLTPADGEAARSETEAA